MCEELHFKFFFFLTKQYLILEIKGIFRHAITKTITTSTTNSVAHFPKISGFASLTGFIDKNTLLGSKNKQLTSTSQNFQTANVEKYNNSEDCIKCSKIL